MCVVTHALALPTPRAPKKARAERSILQHSSATGASLLSGNAWLASDADCKPSPPLHEYLLGANERRGVKVRVHFGDEVQNRRRIFIQPLERILIDLPRRSTA